MTLKCLVSTRQLWKYRAISAVDRTPRRATTLRTSAWLLLRMRVGRLHQWRCWKYSDCSGVIGWWWWLIFDVFLHACMDSFLQSRLVEDIQLAYVCVTCVPTEQTLDSMFCRIKLVLGHADLHQQQLPHFVAVAQQSSASFYRPSWLHSCQSKVETYHNSLLCRRLCLSVRGDCDCMTDVFHQSSFVRS